MAVCTSNHMLVNLFIKMNILTTKSIQVKFNSKFKKMLWKQDND